MALIGVRELREQASELIRRVREEQAEYVITYQGRPVAVLLPLNAAQAEVEMVQAGKRVISNSWEQYERLAQDLREHWPADLSTQDVLDMIRRQGIIKDQVPA
ncbi:MAG: type II toxin-antitoxin system Phd/YefM family antitoxin [Anaerolineae bacterium]|nr:type II toxin-antitoxin system Phd/YefM family antitoxin [Anaerolineae bacterium]